MTWVVFSKAMKSLLVALCLVTVALVASLVRYDITPAAVPLAGGRDVALCVRLDRWTGAVHVGRQMTVGQDDGQQIVGWIWEPMGADLETLGKIYRESLSAR